MSRERFLTVVSISLALMLVGCAVEYATRFSIGSNKHGSASAAEMLKRKVVDLEVLLLPTGVSGTQLVYIAVADDGSIWQKVGVGRWEFIAGPPPKKED